MSASYSEGKAGGLSTGPDQDGSVNSSFLHKDSCHISAKKPNVIPQFKKMYFWTEEWHLAFWQDFSGKDTEDEVKSWVAFSHQDTDLSAG